MVNISIDAAVEVPCWYFVATMATLSAGLIVHYSTSETYKTKILDRIDRCLDNARQAYEDQYGGE